MTDRAPASHDLALPGVTLYLDTYGDQTATDRAVFLVHGITANSRYWSRVGLEIAAEGRFALAPDLRGRGRSAKPAHGYGLPFHAADLLAVADRFDLKTFDLVGHSLGALVGLYLAACVPDRLRRLVLVDAGGALPADTMQAIAPALARLGTPYPSLDAYLETMLAAPHLAGSDRAFWDAYYRYDAETRPDGTVVSGVPKDAIAQEQAALYLTKTELLPNFVKAPTLIVRATDGLLGPDAGHILPRAEAERLAGIIPGSRFVEIPGTNHYTVVLAAGFGAAVAGFLNEGEATDRRC